MRPCVEQHYSRLPRSGYGFIMRFSHHGELGTCSIASVLAYVYFVIGLASVKFLPQVSKISTPKQTFLARVRTSIFTCSLLLFADLDPALFFLTAIASPPAPIAVLMEVHRRGKLNLQIGRGMMMKMPLLAPTSRRMWRNRSFDDTNDRGVLSGSGDEERWTNVKHDAKQLFSVSLFFRPFSRQSP